MAPKNGKTEAKPSRPRARKAPGQFAAKPEDFEPDTPLSKVQDKKNKDRSKGTRDGADAHVRKQVSKCLKDNFPTLSEAEVYHKKVNGQTLYQVLWDDKMKAHRKSEDAPRFGRTYFDEKRKLYSSVSELSELVVERDEVVNDALFEAVDMSRSKPPRREKLLLWCRTSSHVLNQTEVVGLIAHAFELVPTAINYNLNIELVKYMLRVGAKRSFPKEFEIFLPHIDRVLAFGYGHLRSKGLGLEEFCHSNKDLISEVLPYDSVLKLLQAKGTWDGLESEIETITSYSNSQLGSKMFAFARSASANLRVSKFIDDGLVQGLGDGNLTVKAVGDVREALQKQMQTDINKDDLDRPRVVTLKYHGGIEVKLEACV